MIGGPAQEPISQSVVPHARLPGELCESYRSSIRAVNDHIPRCIVVLLNGCCPIAVGRLIVLFRISSFDAVLLRRSPPHVLQKTLVTIEPSLTDSDPLRAIMFIGPLCFSVAPAFYIEPCFIFFGGSMSFAMRLLRLAGRFICKASTACGMPLLERSAVDQSLLPAIAFAKPANELATVRSLTKHGQSSISMASTINFLHSWIISYPHRSSVCRAAAM